MDRSVGCPPVRLGVKRVGSKNREMWGAHKPEKLFSGENGFMKGERVCARVCVCVCVVRACVCVCVCDKWRRSRLGKLIAVSV
jgi:hypothetical protein